MSIRARMSSVSSTSCLTAVLIVESDEAMKSASRPGSAMFIASVWRSSESSGESDTTCWKFVLMLRASASISRRSASFVSSAAALTRARRYGCGRHDLVEREPRQSLDDQPQAAVGQLEHLVNVRRRADAEQILLLRLFDRRVALREHGDQLAVRDRVVDQTHRALAGDGERHERIRKEDRVPKRQNRQLRRNRKRPIADREVLGLEVLELIAHRDLTSGPGNPDRTLNCGRRRWGEMGSATGEAPIGDAGCYMSRKSELAPRRAVA